MNPDRSKVLLRKTLVRTNVRPIFNGAPVELPEWPLFAEKRMPILEIRIAGGTGMQPSHKMFHFVGTL